MAFSRGVVLSGSPRVKVPDNVRRVMESVPLLTKDRERLLLEQAQNCVLLPENREKARQELIEANLCWVYKVAQRYWSTGFEAEDFFHLGILGLIHAIDVFDLRRNVRLSTYATFWIRQQILAEIEAKTHVIRIPKKGNRDRMTNEIINERIAKILEGVKSLSHHEHEGRNAIASDCEELIVRDTSAKQVLAMDTRKMVRRALRRLPYREKIVVWLKMRNRSNIEIGRLLDLSAETIRKIEIRAHEKLREILTSMGFGES